MDEPRIEGACFEPLQVRDLVSMADQQSHEAAAQFAKDIQMPVQAAVKAAFGDKAAATTDAATEATTAPPSMLPQPNR